MYFGSGLGLDSSGYAMEEALYRALGTPPKFSPLTIDGTAKMMMAGAMGEFFGLNPKTDYDNVEMLIYVGTNPMVSHAHNTGMFNPAVLDPVGRRARRGLDDRPAAHRDGEVVHPPHRRLSRQGLRDPRLARRARSSMAARSIPQQPIDGLDELRAALEGYDRAKAAAIAGVPEQDLDDLLAAIRRKRRVVASRPAPASPCRPAAT